MFGSESIGTQRGGGIRGQNTLDFSGFVPGPKQGGHASGGGGGRNVGKPVDSPVNPVPFAVLDVIEVDAVGVADFDGLRGGKASVLFCGQFSQIPSQFF